ncbi:MAG TPA: oxidoreductase, partial [Aldersonia sp.]
MTSTIRKRPEPARPPTPRRHLLSRVLSGVLAAAVVIGVGELIAVLIAPAAAPFLAVGSSTVDRTPAFAREFAIQTFGTNDKPALFVGMALIIVGIAAVAGIAERTRGPIGSLILGMLGVVGVSAALARPGATWVYVVPTVVGVIAGISVLRILTAAAREPVATNDAAEYSRRRFLVLATTATAVAAASAAGARYLGQQIAGAVENRLGFRIPGVAAADRAPAIVAGTDIGVPGVTPFITSNADFYRIDTALRVPQLTTDQWRLRIHGMVARELTL